MHFSIRLHLLNGGNIFGVLYSSVPRPCTSAHIVEWNGDVILHTEEWSKMFSSLMTGSLIA
jgi:hypothetical protein